MTVRTRIAPSPTGDPHVGTAYIALFNYAFAKKNRGEFILRIEDTDRERSSAESEEMILQSLRWLGLEWDEGPDVGGPHGPYRQSERGEIYREHAHLLLDQGHAFRCFCTQERLDALRQSQRAAGDSNLGYDGHCLGIPQAEAEQRAVQGEPHVVRMKVPSEGEIVVHDMLRGEIVFEVSKVDMQILLKADGMPTYHLANVVDDHLMGITHILRGEEWIPSAPKHLLLYGYFGWEAPKLCHLPLLRNSDRSKLSKRKNPTSILYYERMGILPEALRNYLGRMAWSMPDDSEKFSLEDMVLNFDLDRISLGGPIFDVEKLKWLNGVWIRESLDAEEFMVRFMGWSNLSDLLIQLAPVIQQRAELLSDVEPMISYFLRGHLSPTREALVVGKLDSDQIRTALESVLARLDPMLSWERDAIYAAVNAVLTEQGIKLRDLIKPLYVAITGSPSGIPLFECMALLGKDVCRARMREAISVL